jgi:hypothetical protein
LEEIIYFPKIEHFAEHSFPFPFSFFIILFEKLEIDTHNFINFCIEMTAKTTTTYVLVLAFVAAYFHALNFVNGASLPVMVKREDDAGGQQQQVK